MQTIKQVELVNKKEWTNIFPVVSSSVDSLLFVKHLTGLAIPTILYIRKILPSSEFESKVFEGMTLKILKKGTKNAGAQRIETWLAGAYDALEKKYLKSLSLEIKDSQSDLTLEIYTINIMKETNSASMCVSVSPLFGENVTFRNSKDQISNIQIQTVRFLQMCYSVMKSCSELPNEVKLCMKLSYQENTPCGYHPFGYKEYLPTMPIFLKNTRTIQIGVINTNHHVIEFMNKTCMCDEAILPKSGKEKNNSYETDPKSQSEDDFNNSKIWKQDPLFGGNTSFSTPKFQNEENNEEKQISSQCTDDGTLPGSQSELVRCPCLSKIKTSIMYLCSGCSYWVHAECFGIMQTKVPIPINAFYCQICHKLNKDNVCHDEAMTNLKRASDQQKLAVRRRFLSFCHTFNEQKITLSKFERISGLVWHQTLIQKIVKEMIRAGVIKEQSDFIFMVNRNVLSQKLAQFFYSESALKNKFSKKNRKKILISPLTHELKKRKSETDEEPQKKSRFFDRSPWQFKNLQ